MPVRLIIYTIAAVAAALVAGLIVAQRTRDADEVTRVARTLASVERIRQEVHVRRALETADLNEASWPARPEPTWFAEGVPSNDLVDRNRPWLEIAPASQAALDHPPLRVATDETVAAFWYNPYSGVVRARAPKRVSDQRSTELYNAINSTRVAGVIDLEWIALDLHRRDDIRRSTALAATNVSAVDEVESLDPMSPLMPADDRE